jgi:hypothetical protein
MSNTYWIAMVTTSLPTATELSLSPESDFWSSFLEDDMLPFLLRPSNIIESHGTVVHVATPTAHS